MRAWYIVALLMIVIISGCATKEGTTTPEKTTTSEAGTAEKTAEEETTEATEEVAEEETTEATEEVAEEETTTSEGDIFMTLSGFDPAETTTTVGSTLTLKAVEGDHLLTIGGKSTGKIKEGDTYEVTFDKEGKVKIFDVFTKKSATVTVTAEETE